MREKGKQGIPKRGMLELRAAQREDGVVGKNLREGREHVGRGGGRDGEGGARKFSDMVKQLARRAVPVECGGRVDASEWQVEHRPDTID